MVDKKSNQQNSGSINLARLVYDWIRANKAGSDWIIIPQDTFAVTHRLQDTPINKDLLGYGAVLDGYGWYFTIYEDYLTAGIGRTPNGDRYDTGFLIDASDPEFFNKLEAKLDSIEATWPERHAKTMEAAKAAIERMKKDDSPRFGLSEE